jgi:hypothetical protein
LSIPLNRALEGVVGRIGWIGRVGKRPVTGATNIQLHDLDDGPQLLIRVGRFEDSRRRLRTVRR